MASFGAPAEGVAPIFWVGDLQQHLGMAGAIEAAPAGEVTAAEITAGRGQEVSAAEQALAEQCDGLSVAVGAPAGCQS